MRKTKIGNIIFCIVLMIAIVFTIACTGPQGEKGEQGKNGLDGISVTNAYINEEGYLITSNGEQIDLNDVDVKVTISFNDITLTDNEEDGMVYGTVISSIYKGDHYQVIVRTDENEEDYILDTEYTYNVDDRVGVIIPSEKIKLALKVANNAK